MPEFFQTQMGHLFYEGTIPRIAKALERIATALEKQNEPPVVANTDNIPVYVDGNPEDERPHRKRERKSVVLEEHLKGVNLADMIGKK